MKKFITTTIIASLISINCAYANDQMATDGYAYIGLQAGLSEPVVKSFDHKDSGTTIRLKQSRILGARVGYSFYPGMMIELSGSHQPKYRLAYLLPKTDTQIGPIPSTPGITRVIANTYMMNFIYEAQKMSLLDIKPYVIFGAGMTRVSVKPTTSKFKLPTLPALALGKESIDIFKIKNTNTNCFAYQFGAGIARDVGNNFAIDFGVNMQVISNIKIKYAKLTDTLTQTFTDQASIKKTIGIGEFTLGLTYKIAP
jgi:opacity protein-like surface antigen